MCSSDLDVLSWNHRKYFDIKTSLTDEEFAVLKEEFDQLIRDFQEFRVKFPKDRYLGAYADLCATILPLYKAKRSPDLPKQFKAIEQKYPDMPAVGIMSSWWNAISLASSDTEKAREVFRHIATKYEKHDWKLEIGRAHV